VEHHFLAGPAFSRGSERETWQNLDALHAAGIGAIVSLIPLKDLLWNARLLPRIEEEIRLRFSFQAFPLHDGTVPRRLKMRAILDAIDLELTRGRKVFLHCLAGRGRTGIVVGCWLVRHGLAERLGVLDRIAELRAKAGLSSPSPETEAQCALVTSWRYRE
jgi:protein-tyrosine phosphatase